MSRNYLIQEKYSNFMKTLRLIQQFIRDESGPTAVEYAIMLALILAVVIASITLVGTETSALFQHSADSMDGNWVPGT